MNYNTYRLNNGLRIIHLPSSSPVTYCGYEINAGTRHEEKGEEGIAHFCEHLTFKGTARRRPFQIINCLENKGGDLNAFTNKEDTVFHAAILKEHLPQAIDLLTDIVFHSTYPQNEIEKEVEVVCDEIESYNDSPAELIYDEFENLIFEGHPLGHSILGNAEQLRTYTTSNAKAFAGRFYRPDNAVFFIYGDVDFKHVVRLLQKATSDFPEVPEKEAEHGASPLPSYTPREIVVEKNTHQAHVMIGARTYDINDKRRMPLYLLNNVLGGPGMNARLNLALRERNALVYTIESAMVSYGDTGAWNVYFGCDAHDITKCLRLVRRELDKFVNRPLSDNQLRTAKRQIKGQIAIACDSRENFALDFGKSFLHYGWERDIAHLFKDIDEITAEDMQKVAQEVFDERQLTTLIYK